MRNLSNAAESMKEKGNEWDWNDKTGQRNTRWAAAGAKGMILGTTTRRREKDKKRWENARLR